MAADDRCLVTGGSGFAGKHLVARLRDRGFEVIAPQHGELNLLDADALKDYVREVRPERVFHLAALASVARSWEAPAKTVCANQEMTVNLLEALRLDAPQAAVLVASSGEVYGAPEQLPVTEDAPVRPRSPYAVSKVGSELVAELYGRIHGLRVVLTRAFNHAGPGQSADYVVGSLTRQIAEAEIRGLDPVTVRTGDPSVSRDFCDVRDVVQAYEVAIDAEAPGPYNVASGRAVAVGELVSALGTVTQIDIRHEVDPTRVRPDDAPCVEGSAARLEEATGWRAEIPLAQTLADAVAAWREELPCA